MGARARGRAAILGVGAALPEKQVASADLERALGLPPGWIQQRTGIVRRPVAGEGEATSDLAVRAGAEALRAAGVSPGDVRLLLLATSTPDHLLPPTAPAVAHRLALRRAGAADLAAACAGFLYALSLAGAYCEGGGGPVLVIGANVLTRRVDPRDPATVALFADGAGAAVVAPGEGERGLLATHLASDGSRWDSILIPAGGSRQPVTPERVAAGEHLMRLSNGRSLFREAVRDMAEAGRAALAAAGLSASAVDWWIPHQANRRIIAEAGRLLEIPAERTVDVIDRYGNASSATVPMALAEAVKEGKVRPGHVLLLTAVGAGMLSAGAVIRW